MAIYRSELSAIVCGVNAGMTPIMTVQSWQEQYKSGFVEDLTKKHSDTEKLNEDVKSLKAALSEVHDD